MPILPENLLEPISEDNPCGEPAASLKNYEKLREVRKPNEAAIEAFMAPRPDGSPRVMTRDIWAPREPNRVIEMILDMLSARSKDLELGVWLAESLLWRYGLSGFLEGLALVRGMLDRYWDQLHPLPDEGDYYMRIRHLEWVGMTESVKDSSPPLAIGFIPVTQNGLTLNQFVDARGVPLEAEAGQSQSATDKRQEALAAGKTTPEEFGTAFDATPKAFYKDLKANVTACREAIEGLDEFCREKFSDAPGFTKIKGALEKAEGEILVLLRRKLEKDPDPVEMAALNAPTIGADGQPIARAFTAVSAAAFDDMVAAIGEVSGIEPGSPEEAIVRIAVAARYLRRQNPANPMPYLLMRGMRWGELFSAGEELPVGSLSAPSTEVRTNLRQLAAGGAWPEVLELCESAMATECGRAWLDLQRYAVRACEELGYEGVGRAIRQGVKHLLEDYPSLASATMLDDTGVANPETAAWLAGLAQPAE
jgi:type VI secretion system protein ImpA